MKPILEVHDISKKFARRADKHKSYALKDLLTDVFNVRKSVHIRPDEFYAIKNVSFNLFPGDSIGLIGRNGCGKSTTLRICAGLIRPDSGKVIVRGALQALISLGAGFSPQLSGVENIKNSAAMLGLTQTETRRVIGEVIEFSELGEFIDSPISSYSSGMYARLGFAVAVHLKPDLLFIDEILGVGDFAFQNKCFIKMNELQRKGVTVVLVSHSHGRITQMCEKAIWLKDGIVEAFGDSTDTVKKYIKHFDELENAKLVNEKMAEAENEAKSRFLAEGLFGGEFNGDGYVEQIAVQVTSRGSEFTALDTHDPLEVDVDLKLISPPKRLKLGLVFYREDGERVAVNTSTEEEAINDFNKKQFRLRITYPSFCLRPGKYTLVIPIQDGQSFLYRLPVKKFLVRGAVDRTLGLVSVPVEFKEII